MIEGRPVAGFGRPGRAGVPPPAADGDGTPSLPARSRDTDGDGTPSLKVDCFIRAIEQTAPVLQNSPKIGHLGKYAFVCLYKSYFCGLVEIYRAVDETGGKMKGH